jgi:hypothetical protein
MEKMLDLYSDYLLSSFQQTTATGLSRLTDGQISHDKVSRFLSEKDNGSKELWQHVKALVRKHETEDGCLIFDDSIIEKPYTDESELVCWHYDHSKGKSVKGINILSAFYHSCNDSLPATVEAIRLPIMYQLVLKTITYSVVKTRKSKRKSETTKNSMMLEMIAQAIHNQLKFKYVLADSWFASAENMRFIKKKKKFFIFDMKSNRNAVLNEKDRNKGQWSRIDELDILDNTSVKVWLKDLEFPVLLTKQVFKNKDQSTGVRFLVSNDFSLSDDQFTTIYKKRWSVEEYHKSLKQNTAIAKSPTRTTRTQCNHIFASIVAYIKLEKLKMVNEMNHFAMKSKLYLSALKAAFKELAILKDNSAFA